jgi:thiol-disulfide isomerase/thioredoxin
MLKRVLIVMATLVVAIFYAFYSDNALKSNLGRGVVSLSKLPDVTFVDINETSFQIDKQKDSDKKLHYVHFWATWCAPCEVEFPKLVKFIQELKDKPINFYLVAVNDQKEKVMKKMARYSNLPQNVFLIFDNKNVHLEKYGTARIPETFVFNNRYSLEKKYTGPQTWEHPEMLKQAKNLLNKLQY